ncbi:P22 phage major capsid protein family protein [Nesterenkonia haasae]|uniref:P22 phage major capsid protein family protein n=1 Tax=Nesterenkonia haasae TaxID=2587813 RepID=UPI0013919D70|nr:P22 phage major capsid protein family protein [Nesterenkonia haasae]NDK31186.1 coat protein [Nesterenkonia haasae]
MSVENFIPEIWSAALLQSLRDRLVYGQAGVINRNYEGEIAQAGDTVHITSFGDPAVREYTKNETISWDLLESDQQSLIIDQADYFAFKVDDIDRRQAMSGFVEESTTGASYNLAAETDAYLAGKMSDAAVDGSDLGAIEVAHARDAYNLLLKLRTRLTRTNTPDEGRFAVIPPELYGVLLRDDRFIRADASGTTEGLRNGVVGRAAGFDVIEGNRVPENAGAYTILAGHGIATTFAEQIASTEAMRLENTFGDGVRGLHLYGARVVRPDNVAKATVTIDPAAEEGGGDGEG